VGFNRLYDAAMLSEILAAARDRASAAARRYEEFRSRAVQAPAPRDFVAAMTGTRLRVVAEIKRRSPSRGILAPALDPGQTARAYAKGGAAAVSVLTEPDYFDGSLRDLIAVRRAVEMPVLRKDFLLDPSQVFQARAAGADAVLVIVAAVDDGQLVDLVRAAEDAGIVALVEIHDARELGRALTAGARLVGVNNRNLETFVTDLGVAEALAPALVDTGVVTIAESGVSDPEGATRMAAAGYDAILVGEAAVTSVDPAALIRSLQVGR
jgi:indole-3-glycerol phosphate synthase